MRDFLIVFISNLLEKEKSPYDIHNDAIGMGANEEEFYLCFNAGMLLLKERIDSAKRIKPPFGRK